MNSSVQITVLLVCAFFSSCFGSYGPDYGYENGPGKKPEGSSGQSGHVVQAALHSKHTIRYVNVDIPYQEREPSIIQVEGGAIPLEIHFKSASSRIRVRQSHSSAGAGEVKHTSSEEEPTRLVHSVTKPIIQEVREIITPYRRVIQEIKPVQEEIHTVVAKKSTETQESNNSGGIVGSVSSGGISGGGISGSGEYGPGLKGVSGNVKRSTRWSNNYGSRY